MKIAHSAPQFFWGFDSSKFAVGRKLNLQSSRLETIMRAAIYVASLQSTDTELCIELGNAPIAWVNRVGADIVCTQGSRFWAGGYCPDDFWPIVKASFDAAMARGVEVPPPFYGENRERDWALEVDAAQRAAHEAAERQDPTSKRWRTPVLA